MVAGNHGELIGSPSVDDAIHSRFPTQDSYVQCLPFLLNVVRDGLPVRRSAEARDFWHTQADAFRQARDFEDEQAKNWQRAAGRNSRRPVTIGMTKHRAGRP